MRFRLAGLALTLLLAACGGGKSPVATTAPAPATSAPDTTGGVTWSDYAAGLRATIDSSAAAKDCSSLQSQFDTADANSAATQSRTGHGNSALMAYIDAAMRGAGCY